MNQYQIKMLDLAKQLEQISQDLESTVQLLIEEVSQRNYKQTNYDSKGY